MFIAAIPYLNYQIFVLCDLLPSSHCLNCSVILTNKLSLVCIRTVCVETLSVAMDSHKM